MFHSQIERLAHPAFFGFYLIFPLALLHLKLGMFIVVGLISIAPTLRFIRWRRELRATGKLPGEDEVKGARKLVMLQAHIIPLIPLAAVFLARGFGGR